MKRRVAGAGLRRHRPRRRFRWEYIRGKYSGMTAEERFWRAFDEMEKEEDGYRERFEWWRRRRAGIEEGGAERSEPASSRET